MILRTEIKIIEIIERCFYTNQETVRSEIAPAVIWKDVLSIKVFILILHYTGLLANVRKAEETCRWSYSTLHSGSENVS